MIDDLLSIVDVPGALLRNTLAGRNPLQGIATDEERTSGRDLLEAWGILDPNEEGLDWGDVAGVGVDLFADPLNLLGVLGVWKGAKWLSKARQASDALPAVSQAVDPVSDVVETLGRRQLHPYQTLRPDNYQVAPPASEILDRLPPMPDEAATAGGMLDELTPPVAPLDLPPAPKMRPRRKPAPPPEYPMPKYPVEGFYSRLEKAAETLPNPPKGIKAESLRNMLQKAPEGFSAEEWKLYGMDDLVTQGGRIEKADILRHMATNRPRLRFGGLTKPQDLEAIDYSKYNPPGFESGSYLEEGLQSPLTGDDAADFLNHAFKEKNVIGWRRAGTHANPQGEKVHVAYEFQSDAHQAGRADPRYGSKVAPLKKEWTDPLIRRHIQDAVDRGADRVGFTTGDTAAQFSGGQLSGQRAFYGAAPSSVPVADAARIVDLEAEIAAKHFPEWVGEAKAIREWFEGGASLSGPLYTKAESAIRKLVEEGLVEPGVAHALTASKSAKIPTAVEKYLKQRGWDTKLERDVIVGPGGEQYPIFSFKITDKMRKDLAKRGQPLFSIGLPLGLGAGALVTDPLGGDF